MSPSRRRRCVLRAGSASAGMEDFATRTYGTRELDNRPLFGETSPRVTSPSRPASPSGVLSGDPRRAPWRGLGGLRSPGRPFPAAGLGREGSGVLRGARDAPPSAEVLVQEGSGQEDSFSGGSSASIREPVEKALAGWATSRVSGQLLGAPLAPLLARLFLSPPG